MHPKCSSDKPAAESTAVAFGVAGRDAALSPSESVAKACVDACASAEATMIITLTLTGTSARLLSKYRPRCPIMVLASDPPVGAALNLHRGVIPFFYPHPFQPAIPNTVGGVGAVYRCGG